MANKVGGIVYLKVDGSLKSAKGDFTYNLGHPKREAVIGTGDIPGYKEVPQVAFIEGAITDRPGLSLSTLVLDTDRSVTLELNNGKTIILSEAWYAGEGTVNTGEGEIGVRWESAREGQEN